MNSTHSRRKLSEAAFFLAKLEVPHCELPDFNYYLSAYFSAARSVSWVLKAEYKNELWFKSWYETFKATVEDEEFMKVINAIRVRTEKFEPVVAVPTFIGGLPVHESLPAAVAEREAETRSKRSVTFTHPAGITITSVLAESATNLHLQGCELRLPEFPNYDITLACRRYFELIDKLVSECEQQA